MYPLSRGNGSGSGSLVVALDKCVNRDYHDDGRQVAIHGPECKQARRRPDEVLELRAGVQLP